MFSLSKLVVGSSRARKPQLRQKVSASAKRITNDARTYERKGKLTVDVRVEDDFTSHVSLTNLRIFGIYHKTLKM